MVEKMNELTNVTDTKKEKILTTIGGYLMTEGWCMEYEKPDQANNVIISIQEVMEKFRTGAKKYFLMENYGEYFQDLEDAWEDYTEGLMQELDTDDETIILEHIEKKLKEAEPK